MKRVMQAVGPLTMSRLYSEGAMQLTHMGYFRRLNFKGRNEFKNEDIEDGTSG